MNTHRRVVFALAVACVIGIPASARAQAVGAPAACDAPRDLCEFFDRYLKAFNSRDFDGFSATFADDITFFVDRPFPPERVDGRSAVEAIFRPGFAAAHPGPGITPPPLPPALVPVNLRLQVIGDVAVISFVVHNPMEVARRTLVARTGPDGWRIVHIHGSSADVRGR